MMDEGWRVESRWQQGHWQWRLENEGVSNVKNVAEKQRGGD
jgi:hypothetical protein